MDQITQNFFFHVLVKHILYQRPKVGLRGRWDVVACGMELAHVHCLVFLLHMGEWKPRTFSYLKRGGIGSKGQFCSLEGGICTKNISSDFFTDVQICRAVLRGSNRGGKKALEGYGLKKRKNSYRKKTKQEEQAELAELGSASRSRNCYIIYGCRMKITAWASPTLQTSSKRTFTTRPKSWPWQRKTTAVLGWSGDQKTFWLFYGWDH